MNANTLARWNRDRFRRYWARISRRRYPGRPRIDAEIGRLVHTMAQDGWGAPRIHAELTKLGFKPISVEVNVTSQFSVSDNGVLVYRTGASPADARRMGWYDRSGTALASMEKGEAQ